MLTHHAAALLLISLLTGYANGHGLMVDPPSRNTMWRLGYDNGVNYDDMGLNCGGFQNQWEVNGGKCGVCGDPYQGPLRHETGYPGGYANGIIGRVYKAGDTIEVTAKITANHLGYVQYKICPVNDKSKEVTQHCLDKYPLKDKWGNDKFKVYDQIRNSAGLVKARVVLPSGLVCSRCVVQWTYTAGNNAGKRQETFVNCADVQITKGVGTQPDRPNFSALKRREGGVTKLDANKVPIGQYDCNVQSPFNKGDNHQKIYDWCLKQCIELEPNSRRCPASHCKCFRLEKAPAVSTNHNHQHHMKISSAGKVSPPTTTSYDETISRRRNYNQQGTATSSRQSSPTRHQSKQGGGRHRCSLNSPYDRQELKRYLLDWCETVCGDPTSADYRYCDRNICRC